MTHTRMFQEYLVSLEKLSLFFIQVKIIQVLVFDNWHPLKCYFFKCQFCLRHIRVFYFIMTLKLYSQNSFFLSFIVEKVPLPGH